ncbi:MAG: zinc-binding dehydrogenase [Pirellulaceae bacterium]|nr:alcohol dehydrogenase [Planctomycetaceae bacterium]HIM31936.1 alcohol dehydrogenase [Planctomycetota bacterium]
MLAGIIDEKRKVRLVEVDEPALGDGHGQILFQPELACLCGSDLPYFTGQTPEFPGVVGQSLHEMIGTVVATTGDRFQAGDRVLCVPKNHLGLCERFVESEEQAIPLDPRASDDEALLAQPLGTVIFAMRKLPNVLGQDVAVVGQGPMGQLFCAVLRNLGARRIIAIDRLSERLKMSSTMGANHLVHAGEQDVQQVVSEITDGRMVDIVVEAVGHEDQAFNMCTDLCKASGRILFFGVPPEQIDGLLWRKLFWKNIEVTTSVGPDFALDFPLAMQWIAEGRINVKPIVTHRFPLARIQEAFETFVDRSDGALKVFIEF